MVQRIAGSRWARHVCHRGPDRRRPVALFADPTGGVFTTSGDAARPADVAKREILQIEYQNPQFDRTDDWAKAIAGGTYPLHADFEWTQFSPPRRSTTSSDWSGLSGG